MNPRDIDIDLAIADRFERWGRFLRAEGATPILVLGLRAADETIVITTLEGMPDGVLTDALVGAVRAIAGGRADPT
jgi:hypothetical protein